MHADAPKVGLAERTFEDLGVLYVSGAGDAAEQTVHDRLHVRAMAFVAGKPEQSGVIVTGDVMDWCEPTAPCRLARRLIRERLGIPADNATFISSHTHAGAYPRTDDQKAAFAERALQAVEEAVETARSVQVGYGQVDLGAGANFNRRVMIDPQYGAHCLMFNPGLTFRPGGAVEATAQIRWFVESEWGGDWRDCGASRRADNFADGATDRFLHVIAFREPGGKMLGGFVRMSAHAVIVSSYWFPDTVSADYPGVLCAALSEAVGGQFHFGQGLGGDTRPCVPANTFEACEAFGAAMAARAAEAVGRMDFAPLDAVALNRRTLRLPVHPDTMPTAAEADAARDQFADEARRNKSAGGPGWRTKRLMEASFFHMMTRRFYEGGFLTEGSPHHGLPAEINVWRIGPAVVASMPGEIFTRTGQQILAGVRPEVRGRLAICTCGTDSREYVPPREDRLLGGYEAACSAVAPGAAEMLAREAIEAVNDL